MAKAPFAAGRETLRELAEQHRDATLEMRRLARKFWFRLGYKLGLL